MNEHQFQNTEPSVLLLTINAQDAAIVRLESRVKELEGERATIWADAHQCGMDDQEHIGDGGSNCCDGNPYTRDEFAIPTQGG